LTAPAVALDRVHKAFGTATAVADLSLTVPRGAIHGVLGPNGAGKTTTLRIIAGILRPDAGRVSVLGDSDPTAIKRRLGYLPEEKGLYRKMRVVDLVRYFGELKGLSKRTALANALRLLDAFGLADRARDRCETLSKGMGQKVQIIGALIHEPELVVLDEPMSGLDPVNVDFVREIIIAQKRAGKTVLISTHVLEQAEQICDELTLVNRGRALLEGPLDALRARAGRTVVVDYQGDKAHFEGLPGVERVDAAGHCAELSLAVDADPDAILRALLQHLRITRFDVRAASLHEIFVRSVRADGAR